MTQDQTQYALNNAAWFVGGIIASSVLWYVLIRRSMRRTGAPRLPRLDVFTASLVGLAMIMSLLFDISTRLRTDQAAECQTNALKARAQPTADFAKAADKFFRRQITGEQLAPYVKAWDEALHKYSLSRC